jgi:two-component system, NarL family, response regulator
MNGSRSTQKYLIVCHQREREVLELIPVGMSNLEIGTTMQITEGTVKSHINNILGKLNVSDRTQAVIVALKQWLIIALFK